MGKIACRTDAMIAAITINNGAKLYTFNLKHFEAFRGLGLEILPFNLEISSKNNKAK